MSTSPASKAFEAFRWAVIRLATYVADANTPPRLLFGSVSLLTNERPRPRGAIGIDRFPVAQGKHGTVLFRRTVLARDQAIAWYRSASSENLQTPMPSEPGEAEPAHDGQLIIASAFLDDPR